MPKEKEKLGFFKLKSEVWLYPGMSAWHFVGVDKKTSEKIKKDFGKNARGFGSLPVLVSIGKTSWNTSIFPDKKSGIYILPVKASVRKKEGVYAGDKVNFSIKVLG